MREIKLRGYAVEEMIDSQWIYGTGVHKTTFTDEYAKETGKKYEYLIWTEMGWVEVLGESIGQYTGLKDKNGKGIYEGDVVKTHDQNNIIQYQHGSFMLIGLYEDRYERNYSRLYHYLIDSTIPNMDGSRFDGVTTTLEIIGNIYEHDNLLKK